MSFSAIRIRKSADLIPDAYKCVFGKGGVAIFLTLMGGVMQFYHLGIWGGQHFFSYSEALSATPPPSAEIYEQSLSVQYR